VASLEGSASSGGGHVAARFVSKATQCIGSGGIARDIVPYIGMIEDCEVLAGAGGEVAGATSEVSNSDAETVSNVSAGPAADGNIDLLQVHDPLAAAAASIRVSALACIGKAAVLPILPGTVDGSRNVVLESPIPVNEVTVEVSADASAEVVSNEDATDEGVEEAADEGDICDICCTIMPPRSEVLECPSCVLWVCRPCQARLSKLLDGSPQIQCLRGCGTLVTATTDGECSSDG